jgi:hypothetical protein
MGKGYNDCRPLRKQPAEKRCLVRWHGECNSIKQKEENAAGGGAERRRVANMLDFSHHLLYNLHLQGKSSVQKVLSRIK